MTCHGLGYFLTGNVHERIAWGLSILLVMTFASYMVKGYIDRYLRFEIRTEIRYDENSTTTLPTLILCLHSTLNSVFACYNEKLIFNGLPCSRNATHTTTLRFRFNDHGEFKNATSIGNNCHVVNDNGLVSLSGPDENIQLLLEANASMQPLLMVLLSHAEYQSREHKLLPTDNFLFFYPGLHQLHVKQTKLTRVEYPYKPNCTKQNLSPNPFSTRYSQRTCLMSCLLKRWIYQCGDVPDTYRDYNSNGIRPYLSTSYEDRWNCLAQVLVNTNVGNCGCQLACEETQYKTREQTFKRWKNISSWNINVFNEETKEIVQVPDYPLADCLGAIGGIMGLAIGASSLSFVELIIYFIMNFRRKAY